MILWADEDQEQGPLHTNFKLSTSGEVIYLLDNNQTMLDSITFGPQTTDKSAARKPNGSGNFVISNHSIGINNDVISSLSELRFNSLKIYPNPASSGLIKIENVSEKNENIAIYNLSGIKVSDYIIPAFSLVGGA